MDKPAVFIETQPDGQLRINAEMVKLLSQISKPITIISIVGELVYNKMQFNPQVNIKSALAASKIILYFSKY